jgi:AraC-like DNA-binding protein
MISHEEKIKQVIEAYSGATGVGMICLDKELKILFDVVTSHEKTDSRLPDFTELLDHIRQMIDSPAEFTNCFATYITRHFFIYNIHILILDDQIHCVLLTEPMSVRLFTDQDIQAFCSEINGSAVEKIKMTKRIKEMPIVSWQRIHQLGAVMRLLTHSILNIDVINQSIGDIHHEIPDSEWFNSKIESILSDPPQAYPLEYGNYKRIREIIQSGDIKSLADFENSFSFGELTFPLTASTDLLRAAKNYFIIFCTITFYCAVDAGMRISEMLNLATKLINEVEQMKQVPDVINHLKRSLEVFTHTVYAFNKQRHGKAILELFSYIHEHYPEKISLQVLSAHIGLNSSYLSSLIHKETGTALTDHINQVRIEASKSDLLHSSLSINEIAQKVGFSYQNHYARVFKKFTGMSPMEYRERKTNKRPENIRRK